MAPAFAVQVSDGTYSDGPQPASINFTNVNDNAPVIPAGQAFSVSEAASNGTRSERSHSAMPICPATVSSSASRQETATAYSPSTTPAI